MSFWCFFYLISKIRKIAHANLRHPLNLSPRVNFKTRGVKPHVCRTTEYALANDQRTGHQSDL